MDNNNNEKEEELERKELTAKDGASNSSQRKGAQEDSEKDPKNSLRRKSDPPSSNDAASLEEERTTTLVDTELQGQGRGVEPSGTTYSDNISERPQPGAERVSAQRGAWKQRRDSKGLKTNKQTKQQGAGAERVSAQRGAWKQPRDSKGLKTTKRTKQPGAEAERLVAQPARRVTWKEQRDTRRRRHQQDSSQGNDDSEGIDPTDENILLSRLSSSMIGREDDRSPTDDVAPETQEEEIIVSRQQASSATTAEDAIELGEAQTTTVSAMLVEDEEADEPIIATAAPEGLYILKDEVEEMLNERIAQNRRLGPWGIAVIALALAAITSAVVVGIILGTSGQSTSPATPSNDTTPAITKEGPPIAKCKQGRIVVPSGSGCSLNKIDPVLLDDGSYDPDGGVLEFSLLPLGPYDVGIHTISLTVIDDEGESDSCPASIVAPGGTSDWFTIQNHAYRFGLCELTWSEAKVLTESQAQCGSQGHLATITSVKEQEFLRSFEMGNVWLGGFQPHGAAEPRGNWTWVNDEGQIYDGYTDWDHGEPNNGKSNENCMAMLGSSRGFHWDDEPCSREYKFLEEVDLDVTVMIGGCNSGVPERFDDVASCALLINPAVAGCGSRRTNSTFDMCLETILAPLVAEGVLTRPEKEKIMFCGSNNTPPLAGCQDVVEVANTADFGCGAEIAINASRFDNQSVDADGDSLYFEAFPAGPYRVGLHDVTMTVHDGHGGSATCQATLSVVEDGSQSTHWAQLGDSAFRLRLCALDWQTAAAFAPETTVCGLQAHLATIASQEETAFLESMFGTDHWIGGFQPADSPEPAGDWTWVNNEGPIFDGYVNWRDNKPNDGGGGEDCLLFSTDGKWDDKSCLGTRTYIEEVDLNGTDCDAIKPPEKPLPSRWVIFENHAYRLQEVHADWTSAQTLATNTTLCGVHGHLATVTSAREQAFVRSYAIGNVWLGGFQPQGAAEPKGNWTWVNDEGQVFDGYTDWDHGEPNSGNEDCMMMLESGRGFHWDDRPCSREYKYLEEVDLDITVMIDGCNSGVKDILLDVDSCSYEITRGLSYCNPNDYDFFVNCMDEYLSVLVAKDSINNEEREAIVACYPTNTTSFPYSSNDTRKANTYTFP